MTRPPVCGAGAIFGLLIVEKERLRRIGREEGDESDRDDRDRETVESESGVSIRDDALRRFTAPTCFRKATCVEIKLQAPHAIVA